VLSLIGYIFTILGLRTLAYSMGYSMRKETPLDNNSDISIVISEDDCTDWCGRLQ